MENYLISNYRGDCEERICSCCGEKYLTNINRTRCSQKCATKMKNKRYKQNSILNPKYEKERLSIIRTGIFEYVTRIN
jgi:hypothetical protein